MSPSTFFFIFSSFSFTLQFSSKNSSTVIESWGLFQCPKWSDSISHQNPIRTNCNGSFNRSNEFKNEFSQQMADISSSIKEPHNKLDADEHIDLGEMTIVEEIESSYNHHGIQRWQQSVHFRPVFVCDTSARLTLQQSASAPLETNNHKQPSLTVINPILNWQH